ncbi:transcriptional regulator, XRE family [Gluconacetobacter diazotrophicus PA1 5]|uniref:helix-turn-helix transcriptional regulator n=1 Tax=Gluconacetobacter diazotrophicus TaxID=33996 RepID=UPI000173B714|nr:helix-turn-helix transcriptional regulator [Gluconacetobacter diazotrophicus]ACI52539.1 transcriptional regulator, XRE family [Gluconacetobacter diazotrophicus PA1 5]
MTAANVELGDFLRARRERLVPDKAGAVRGRRRTPGLRREEVAEAAGISTEWYVKLEQGRAVAPSLTTIDALARALKLNAVERAHLRRLADAKSQPAFSPETVPPIISRFVVSLPHPAYVTGRRWDILAWNDAAAELFDFGAMPLEDRNLLLYILTDPRARRVFGDNWSTEAQRILAIFRPTYDVWADDPAFVELLHRVQAGCGEFEGWWKDHAIRWPSSGTKRLHHPTHGRTAFDYTTFQANDDVGLKVAVYLPIAHS